MRNPVYPARSAAVLSCAPVPAGTHPSPATACAQLHAVNGDTTAQGVWEGKRVSLERTFTNSSIKLSEGRSVFAF